MPTAHKHTSAEVTAAAAGYLQSCSPFSHQNLKGPLQPSDTFSLGYPADTTNPRPGCRTYRS